MIEVTGKLPKIIIDTLSKLDVTVSDVQAAGDDIDVIFTASGVPVSLYAIYVGNYKWLVDELDDPANLFPNLEEGDTVSADAVAKLFTNAITSSLILSFSPLGRIKYGIKDKIDKVRDKVSDIGKRMKDIVDAEDAEEALHDIGTAKLYYYDDRDGKMKNKNFDISGVNVGKVKNTGKKGHYKVLTGNPATQDFQVIHLYRNGDQYRVLEGRRGLNQEDAKLMYEKDDMPYDKMITDGDYIEDGKLTPQAVQKMLGKLENDVDGMYLDKETGDYKEDEVQFDEMTVKKVDMIGGDDLLYKILTVDSKGEYQVVSITLTANQENGSDTINYSFDNLYKAPRIHCEKKEAQYIYDNDIPDKWDDWNKEQGEEENTEEDNVDEASENLETDEYGEVTEEIAASLVLSSLEEDEEEDNVMDIESKKKSKYNGKNVTGCVESDGAVVMAGYDASLEEDNIIA